MGSRKCKPLIVNLSITRGLQVAVSVTRGLKVRIKICHPLSYVPINSLVDAAGGVSSIGYTFKKPYLNVHATGIFESIGILTEEPTGGVITDDDGVFITDEDGNRLFAPWRPLIQTFGKVTSGGSTDYRVTTGLSVVASGAIDSVGQLLIPQTKTVDIASGKVEGLGTSATKFNTVFGVTAQGNVESTGESVTRKEVILFVNVTGGVEAIGDTFQKGMIYAPVSGVIGSSGEMDVPDTWIGIDINVAGNIDAQGTSLGYAAIPVVANGVVSSTGQAQTEDRRIAIASNILNAAGVVSERRIETYIAIATGNIVSSGATDSIALNVFYASVSSALMVTGSTDNGVAPAYNTAASGNVTTAATVDQKAIRIVPIAVGSTIGSSGNINQSLYLSLPVQAIGAVNSGGTTSTEIVAEASVDAVGGSITGNGSVTSTVDPFIILTAPTNLRFCRETDLTEIRWDAVTGAEDYIIERSEDGAPFEFFATTTNTVVYDYDPRYALTTSTVYAYRVAARSGGQTGPTVEGSTTWDTTNNC